MCFQLFSSKLLYRDPIKDTGKIVSFITTANVKVYKYQNANTVGSSMMSVRNGIPCNHIFDCLLVSKTTHDMTYFAQ
jgi:hypothetical protein